MSKRVLSILVVVMLLVLMLPGVASAKGNSPELKAVAQNGHHETADQLKKLEKMVDKANNEIARAVAKAQRTPENDVAELLAKIDQIVAEVGAYAASIGYGLTCDYETYEIDGQSVLIDPLRIIPL
jgi:ferritin-like metal-binding protein YciE